jgi:AraC-like DNA-binding protein
MNQVANPNRLASTTPMMNTLSNKVNFDWNSPVFFEQLARTIKSPLENIIDVGKNSSVYNKEKLEEIIISSSREINDVIEAIVERIQSSSLQLTCHDRPDIFAIYESNEAVRQLCFDVVNPQRITRQDQQWLVSLEKEVYANLDKSCLDLCELSYKMAVSERQLHRKTLELVYLTPNKYVRILRLHKAKQLIDSYVQKSISQIAYAVGYTDVHYFSKLFAQQYAVSPKELLDLRR